MTYAEAVKAGLTEDQMKVIGVEMPKQELKPLGRGFKNNITKEEAEYAIANGGSAYEMGITDDIGGILVEAKFKLTNPKPGKARVMGLHFSIHDGRRSWCSIKDALDGGILSLNEATEEYTYNGSFVYWLEGKPMLASVEAE